MFRVPVFGVLLLAQTSLAFAPSSMLHPGSLLHTVTSSSSLRTRTYGGLVLFISFQYVSTKCLRTRDVMHCDV